MGYKAAIEMTGTKVLAYKYFGSYQGNWIAKVNINGKIMFILDYYGSCSGCDAFEADFGFESHKCGENNYYDPFDSGFRDNCPECQDIKKRLIAFGQEYVDEAISFDECMKRVSEDLDWDMNAQEMVDWMYENKEKLEERNNYNS